MNSIAHFDIDIFRLANKQHQYQYQIDKRFFSLFEHSPVEEGALDVNVTLDKQESLISVHFDIRGTLQLECDRSLEKFNYPIEIQERILYKYGEKEEELSEEILIITSSTQKINLAQFIYEFIGLSVPMRKIHPKYAEEENPFVDGEIIFSSSTAQQENASAEEDQEEPIDPRWNALKNLKNLN
ncbi:MAG: YceD family protein [Cyclobacteriaceae bacterium]